MVDTLGFCGEFGWDGFLVVCFLHKINPNPRKSICCGKKWPKCHFLTCFFLGWVGLELGSSSVSCWRLYVFQPNINFVNRKHPSGNPSLVSLVGSISKCDPSLFWIGIHLTYDPSSMRSVSHPARRLRAPCSMKNEQPVVA